MEKKPEDIETTDESKEHSKCISFEDYQIELSKNITEQLALVFAGFAELQPLNIGKHELDLFEISNGGPEFQIQKLHSIIASLVKRGKKKFTLKMPGLNMFILNLNQKMKHPEAYKFWECILRLTINYIVEQSGKRVLFEAKMTDVDFKDPSKIPGLKLNIYINK